MAGVPAAREPFPVPVYATGRWAEPSGDMRAFIKRLNSLGFPAYDWTQPEHAARPFTEQHDDVHTALLNASAFVFVLGDPAYDHSASVLQLGACLFASTPVIFVDPDHRCHVPGVNGGAEGYYKIISNVHALQALARGQLQVVSTIDEAVECLQRLQWPSTLVPFAPVASAAP